MAEGLGFRVEDAGFRVRVWGLGFRVAGVRVPGLGFRGWVPSSPEASEREQAGVIPA